MPCKKFKPLIDKLFWFIAIPLLVLLCAATTVVCIFPETAAIIIILIVDLCSIWALVSPLCGYVELRENSIFIKCGFFLKREIPYSKIRGISKERKLYADSMLSLKNSLEHVNVKYNVYDLITVSVKDNDGFIKELEERIAKS